MQRSFRLLRLGFGATTFAISLHAGAFTLGGPDCSIAAGSSVWCWGGPVLSGFRSALENAANFGTGGTVPQAVSTVDLNAANFAAALPTLDGFIAPWWTTADAAPYSAAVTSYFLSGGNLLVLADNSGNDPINAALGMPTRFTGAFPASATRDTSGTAPLYRGRSERRPQSGSGAPSASYARPTSSAAAAASSVPMPLAASSPRCGTKDSSLRVRAVLSSPPTWTCWAWAITRRSMTMQGSA